MTEKQPALLPHMARLFAAQARLYCLSALIAGALGLVSLTAVSVFMVRGAGNVELDPRDIWQSMSFSRQLVAIFGLLVALWTPILLAARGVCRITTNQLSGVSMSLTTVLRDMVVFIPTALVYSLVIGFPTMLGAAILFVPGMVIASLFVLVVPTSVNEKSGMIATLRRGVSLISRVFVKALLLTLSCGVLLGLLVVLRAVFLDRFVPGTRTSLFAVRFALVYIPSLFVLVLANICYTLLYYQACGTDKPAGQLEPPPLQP